MNVDRPFTAVTGASGFIGQCLCRDLIAGGFDVRAVYRSNAPPVTDSVRVWNVGPDTDWSTALNGIEVVVHLAARVHQRFESSNDAWTEHFKTNALGSARLVRQAAACGVQRVVFLSTVGVFGNNTDGRPPFTSQDVPAPQSAYAHSKLWGEILMQQASRESGIDLVIVRAPLVYGPGAKGNINTLLRLIHSRFPLPFRSINNHRSFVGVQNLIDLLKCCICDARASGRTLLVSDDEDLSTPDLIRQIAVELAVTPRLFPVSVRLLKSVAHIVGLAPMLNQLVGSFQVDIAETKSLLDWSPVTRIGLELRRTVQAYVKQNESKQH